FEDRIVGIGDADETILVLERPLLALLVLLELVEREHARAKTQTNQLMSAADSKHRSFGLANKVSELVEKRLLVIIKIAQGAAEHDGVRLEPRRRVRDLRHVDH